MAVTTPMSWCTSYRVAHRTLVVPFTFPRCVISSAVHGGGIVQAHAIINHQVPDLNLPEHAHAPIEDPGRYLGRLAKRVGVEGRCVGLMTAVDLGCLVLQRDEMNGIWIEGFFTVGVTNAVRAGEPTTDVFSGKPQGEVGTINMILVTNARLSRAAMVGAVGVATESKTATLLDQGIQNTSGTLMATGTGTDVVALAGSNGPYCRYSGTHTKMGELIGRVVTAGVKEGLQKERAWRKRHNRLIVCIE